jgi:hypothetical protein
VDDDGLSFIDILLYADTCDLRSHEDMLEGKKHMCGAINIEEIFFEDKRAILDKKRVAVLCSGLLYDMVLEWIDSMNKNLQLRE